MSGFPNQNEHDAQHGAAEAPPADAVLPVEPLIAEPAPIADPTPEAAADAEVAPPYLGQFANPKPDIDYKKLGQAFRLRVLIFLGIFLVLLAAAYFSGAVHLPPAN